MKRAIAGLLISLASLFAALFCVFMLLLGVNGALDFWGLETVAAALVMAVIGVLLDD